MEVVIVMTSISKPKRTVVAIRSKLITTTVHFVMFFNLSTSPRVKVRVRNRLTLLLI